jgi:hypothetical protein
MGFLYGVAMNPVAYHNPTAGDRVKMRALAVVPHSLSLEGRGFQNNPYFAFTSKQYRLSS